MRRSSLVLTSAALLAGLILPVASARGFRGPAARTTLLPVEHAGRPLQEADDLVHAPEASAVGGNALFVVGSTSLSAGDTAVRNRLQALSFTLTIKSASSAQTSDADGMALVFVSSSASATSVNTKFRDVAVPVVVAQKDIFDDMKMTGTTSGTHFGSTASQTQVVISSAGHPLAGGFTGTQTVATSSTFAWGQVSAGGVKAATIVGQSTRAAIFGYEPGATMVGLTAPARRVGFFLSSNTFNTTGWTLFDAAVTWASNKVSAPYFNPWGGIYPHTELPTVEIITDTPGAEIRYTTDNTTPTASSPLYTAPIPITTTTNLEARAFLSGWAPSDSTLDVYQVSFGTVADPVLTPNGGSAVDSIVASITAEPGAAIHYTVDGSEPQEWSQSYSGALTFTANTDLRARAFKTDWTPSGTASALFQVRPPAPTINLAPGTYPLGQTTTVTANGANVTLRYSINGNDPTEADPIVASGGSIPIGSFTLKVNAWRPGQSPSDSATATYEATGRITNGAVAAGASHSLALRPDGTVLQWGYGSANTPSLVNGLNGVKAIAAGSSGESFAVKTDGTVWTWGPSVSLSQKAGLADVVRVSAGSAHSLALDTTGRLWAWGENADGQLGNGMTTSSTTPVQVSNLTNVTAFSAGGSHSLAVTSDGQAWAWGSSAYGKLGDGSSTSQSIPVQVRNQAGEPFAGVIGVSAGGDHSVALTTSGAIYTWGSNQNNQLGVGQTWVTLGLSTYPRWVSPLSGVQNVAAGLKHALVAQLGGVIRSWGGNSNGQLGDGTTTSRESPVLVNAPNALQVSASPAGSHSLALMADGTILAWGANGSGQLGDGTLIQRTSPVTAHQWNFGTAAAPGFTPSPGSYPSQASVALSAEAGAQIYYSTNGSTPTLGHPVYAAPIAVLTTGTVIKAMAWRPDANLSPIASGTYNVHAATPEFTPAGGTFSAGGVAVTVSCATPGATVRYTFNGADPTTSDPVIVSGNTLTLTATGTLRAKAWKSGLDPSPVRSDTYTLNGAATGGSIAAGGWHSLARTGASVPWGWGGNWVGQVGDATLVERWSPALVSGLSAIDALSGGYSHSIALYQGQVWSWGGNSQGQLGVGSSPAQSPVPVAVGGLAPVSMVDAGDNHALALQNDGTVLSWGYNASGQLGDGTTTQRNTPVQVTGLSGVTITRVSAGANHSLAVDSLGRVWAWGVNSNGQLGDNSTTQRSAPVLLSGFGGASIAAVAAGRYHSLALTTTGQVYAWGYNGSGQLGDNTTTQRLVPTAVSSLTGVTAISAGGAHSLALKPTGVVWAWGSGAQVGDGAGVNRLVPVAVQGGLSGVVQVSAGESHSLALTYDGSVWAWGANGNGQIGDGTTTTRLLPVRVSGSNFNWQVGKPVFSPAGPVLTADADPVITITCATPGATIHYTLNGVDPSEADPVVASGGTVTLTQSLTLKAKAWAGDAPPSDVAATAFELRLPTPQISPFGGSPLLVGQVITTTTSNPTATLKYRTDGNTPTEADPTWPAGYALSDSIYLRVKGFKAGWTASNTAQMNYTARAYPPDISLASGSHTGTQSVTLSTPVASSRIHFTTNGVIPTDQDPFVLSGQSVTVDRSLTLKARVWRENWALGEVATADYFITLDPPAVPVFSPPAGSYGSPQSVSVSSATSGATIRYTVDGSNPGPASPAYAGPIAVDGPLTLKAKAFAVDRPSSATATATYAIALSSAAPPNFSVPGGEYATAQLVYAGTATPGATVRFTVDGTDPDAADPIFPPFGLTVSGTLHVRARAFKDGLAPSPVRQASYWIVGMVDAGANHTVALRADGTLWSWGWNSWGQLGDGTTTNRLAPVQVTGPQVWRTVSAGHQHTLALDHLGQVWAWGYNGQGQLGDGTTTARSRPALVPGLQGVIAVSAGETHSLALKANGTVWAWGDNANGELGNGTTTASFVPLQVPGLLGVTRVAASRFFNLALKTDGGGAGTVFVWGEGSYGQMGDGTAIGYGLDRLSPGALLTDTIGIAAGYEHGLAWKADGSLWTWGRLAQAYPSGAIFNAKPTVVSGLASVTTTAGGNGFSVALEAGGTGKAWGANTNGQLGRGTSPNFETSPGAVLNLANGVALSAGTTHGLALRQDGSVMAWGHNAYGQLGIGNTTDQVTPVQVTFAAPLPSDPDGDGLPTPLEGPAGCDPYNFDSNGDGLLDGAAVGAGLSCSDLDMDDDGVQNLLERARGTDPFRPDTDDDGSNDAADCFPLDPTRWVCPPSDPNDHTPPIITLTSPTNATLISSVP
jgi:alpha-tubulin suppressor-like RCC1 family protein